jgi:hypothetical protein
MSNAIELLSSITVFNKYARYLPVQGRREDWAEIVQRNCDMHIAVLPYDGGTYPQAPFSDCTEAEYLEMLPHLEGLDMHDVKEDHDETDLSGEVACSGGMCELV